MDVMSKSSESGHPPPRPSFWSLPNDVALNILARIPRIYHPFLSRVCKSFRSLLFSPEFGATRALIGKAEACIYLCLQHPCENPKPRWYTLAPTTPAQKLIPMPIPSFPDDHPQQPALVSIASEIYVIGGFVKGHRSSKVFILDCRRHQWRTLPNMQIPRGNPTAGLIDGKIHVFGGCSKSCNSFAEIYDPETQSWEPSSPTPTPDLRSVATTTTDSETLGKVLFQMKVASVELGVRRRTRLHWCDLEEPELKWNEVKGFEGPGFISIPNLAGGGRRFKVWWVSFERNQDCLVRNFDIWCGEVSFERRKRRQELYGTVECSKLLYTLDRFESGGLISLLCFATVTL